MQFYYAFNRISNRPVASFLLTLHEAFEYQVIIRKEFPRYGFLVGSLARVRLNFSKWNPEMNTVIDSPFMRITGIASRNS